MHTARKRIECQPPLPARRLYSRVIGHDGGIEGKVLVVQVPESIVGRHLLTRGFEVILEPVERR